MVGEGRKSRPRPQVIRECFFLYLQAFWSFPYEDQQSTMSISPASANINSNLNETKLNSWFSFRCYKT